MLLRQGQRSGAVVKIVIQRKVALKREVGPAKKAGPKSGVDVVVMVAVATFERGSGREVVLV